MKKLKRFTIILLSLVFVVLSACSKDTASKSEKGTDGLTFWGWVPFNDQAKEMVSEFKKTNPDTDVSYQIMDWGAYWDKLSLELSNGGGPDVFVINPDNYNKFKDYMEPLDDLAAEVVGADWKDKFDPTILDSVYYEDQLKVFPEVFSSQFYIFYNKTLIKELGYEVPTDFKGWSDLNKKAGNENVSLLFGGKDALNTAYLYFWFVNNVEPGAIEKAVKGELKFTDKVFVDGLENFQKAVKDGVIPNSSFGLDPYPGADNLFKNRKGLAYLTGDWMSGPYLAGTQLKGSAIENDEIGIIPLPNPNGGKAWVAGSLDHGWAINKNSKHKKEAMALISEWTFGKSSELWANTVFQKPAAKDVSLKLDQLKSEEAKTTFEKVQQSMSDAFAGPRSSGIPEVDNKAGEVVQAVMLGSSSTKDAVKEIQKALDSAKK